MKISQVGTKNYINWFYNTGVNQLNKEMNFNCIIISCNFLSNIIQACRKNNLSSATASKCISVNSGTKFDSYFIFWKHLNFFSKQVQILKIILDNVESLQQVGC